jgi:hypothetical protein
MHFQLQQLLDEFQAASARLDALVDGVPAARWMERADPDRWSVAECVEHLNLTADAYRTGVTAALEEARRRGGPAPARYRRDPAGWLLWKMVGPKARTRVKTTAAFVPGADLDAATIVQRFRRLQDEQVGWVRASDGLSIQAVRVRSPFNERLGYNLFAALSILPRHQHRHLPQAERAS